MALVFADAFDTARFGMSGDVECAKAREEIGLTPLAQCLAKSVSAGTLDAGTGQTTPRDATAYRRGTIPPRRREIREARREFSVQKQTIARRLHRDPR